MAWNGKSMRATEDVEKPSHQSSPASINFAFFELDAFIISESHRSYRFIILSPSHASLLSRLFSTPAPLHSSHRTQRLNTQCYVKRSCTITSSQQVPPSKIAVVSITALSRTRYPCRCMANPNFFNFLLPH